MLPDLSLSLLDHSYHNSFVFFLTVLWIADLVADLWYEALHGDFD